MDVVEAMLFVRGHEKCSARAHGDRVATAGEASLPAEHDVHLVLSVRGLVVDPSGGDAVCTDAHGRDANVLGELVGTAYRRCEGGGRLDVLHGHQSFLGAWRRAGRVAVRPRSASSAGLVGVLKQQMPCQVGRIGVAKT